jgi:dipeptidyl aminopeptidase/acylaminoacyl peptidase
MDTQQIASFGSWHSPISADLVISNAVRPGLVATEDEDIYWIESRPLDGGRNIIVHRAPDGTIRDVTEPPFNARTTVHEYGGGDFAVDQGSVYFSNFADQRLYRQDPVGVPVPITPESPLRYADAVVDRERQRLICVCEDHSATSQEALNTIVTVPLDGLTPPQVLVSGNDFYAAPRLSARGDRLAWLTWQHPNMPWDGTELWVGQIGPNGDIVSTTFVAGGSEDSVLAPQWSPDGTLYFVSDRSGWWNIYRWHDSRVSPVHPKDAEFGVPHWVFGISTYAIISPDLLICAVGTKGLWTLGRLDVTASQLDQIHSPYSEISSLRTTRNGAVFLAGSPAEPTALVALDVANNSLRVLRCFGSETIDRDYLSAPRPIAFATQDGATAYGLFYPPRNEEFVGPAGELPPLLVRSHGGPTSCASSALNLTIQYYTSRGIAVLDVNYAGSTGYGRAYRQRLDGRWGIVDVDDCVNGARFLAQRGDVDRKRLAITGGSAGGFTTLCALTFRNTFKAGASYYGVGDLEALVRDTHKLESRYLDRLIGPYPAERDRYLERSPIHHTDQLKCPLIIFQGLDDTVVPPNQAELIVASLRAKGLPFAYLTFPGEGHDLRSAKNIKRALESELYFYSHIFGFPLSEPIEPIAIDNLPGLDQ